MSNSDMNPTLMQETFQKEIEEWQQSSCPDCGGAIAPQTDPERPFVPNKLIPNLIGRCVICRTYSTKSGIIIER